MTKFRSKRNSVTLEDGVIVKRYTKEESLLQEEENLILLRQAGLAVPAILGKTDNSLSLEYIEGATYATLVEGIDSQMATALCRWLSQYYRITGKIRGDVNLRNFIWTGKGCVGLDFEDLFSIGLPEQDQGRLLAYTVSYDPAFTAGKLMGARHLLRSFLGAGGHREKIRQAYLNEIRAMNKRRSQSYLQPRQAALFFNKMEQTRRCKRMTKKIDQTESAPSPQVLKQVAAIAAQWKDRPEMLIPVLHDIQAIAGNAIQKDVAQVIADQMGVSLAQIYSLATFYSFFSTEKRGKYVIRLCKTAPCHIKGTKGILEAFEKVLEIKAGETTPDGLFTLETCECIGACDESPAALIDSTVYGHLTPEKVKDLVALLRG